jgi:tetratricopeptide (TPR) repeat protein
VVSIHHAAAAAPGGVAGDQGRLPSDGDRLDQARVLAQQGRKAEAERLLASLSTEIDELRAELAARPTRPQQLIHQAQALIVAGRYKEAVGIAHEAYAEAPQDAVVFTGMMKVHADAALGLNRADQYDDAIKILSCAYGHDQTDRTIHRAFAERHYMHAVALQRLNNAERALAAAQQAMAFDPKHRQASDLAELLQADGSAT